MQIISASLSLVLILLAGGQTDVGAGPAPAPCRIVEGSAVGPLRIGMRIADAFAAAGQPVGFVVRSSESVYLLPGETTQITAVQNRIVRLASRQPQCATGRGISVGDPEGKVTVAYAQTAGRIRAEHSGIVRIVYPFDGVSFVLTQGRVSLIEIFTPDRLPAARPQPEASPVVVEARSGTVEIVTLSGRAEGAAFIVSGSVRKVGAPLALFAEVTLFGSDGRAIQTATTSLFPNPVGGADPSTFEERMPLEDIVRRVGVTVRMMNPPNSVVAQALADVRNVSQFSGLAEKLLEVTVLGATPERAAGTLASVTNRSGLRIAGLVIEVEMETSCRNSVVRADGTTGFRTFIDRRQGTIRVGTLPPNARVEAPIELQGVGPCAGFGAEWKVTWKPVSIRVESPEENP